MTDKTNGFHKKEKPGFEEIQIPVPWGHISAKWWGPKAAQPILAIHGWQDNAGTFDNLAPLLAKKGHGILCVDLPGHGLSSHYSPGHAYYIWWDGIHIVRRIVDYFNWKNITIIGHSLGGGIAFLYAASFPDQVKKYVSLDIASPSVRDYKKLIDAVGPCVDKFLHYETMSQDEVPCHEYDEMIDIVYDAYNGGVTRESCEIMMRRGMRPCENKPGHYLFNRDPKLKVAVLGFMTMDQVLEFASRIKCEVLNIRATPGMRMDFPENYPLVLDEIEKQAQKLERHTVEGTHHVHLNDAEAIVDIVHNFLVA